MSKYSKQFKLKAVNTCLLHSIGVEQVATSFNIQASQLRHWLSTYKTLGAAALAPRTNQQVYSSEFKVSVLIYKHQHNKSLLELAAHFKIPSPSTILVWERRYNQGGIDALTNRRGVSRMKKPKNPKDPQISNKSWSELTPAELLREVEYLQAENAYLKKLDALIREKKLAQKIKPKPSGD